MKPRLPGDALESPKDWSASDVSKIRGDLAAKITNGQLPKGVCAVFCLFFCPDDLHIFLTYLPTGYQPTTFSVSDVCCKAHYWYDWAGAYLKLKALYCKPALPTCACSDLVVWVA